MNCLAFYSHQTIPRPLVPRRKSIGGKRSFLRPIMASTSSDDPLTSLTRLLFGQSLPPTILVGVVRQSWTAAWHLMMRQLAPSDASGSYSRPASKFLSPRKITTGHTDFHLYVGLPCPWAHRTLIVRALKGLESAVPISVASPGADGAWEFRQAHEEWGNGQYAPSGDRANGCRTLREVYQLAVVEGGRRYSGRSTLPMLWDVTKKEIFCNESLDIITFFNGEMNDVAENPSLNLYPPELKEEIDGWIARVYSNVNNGVYRCGFAQSQEAYDSAVKTLFETLDYLDSHLYESRYLCGNRLTLADVCLFTTLIRFDLVYNILFKCSKKKVVQYQNLHGYMRDIYQIPKVAETCNLEEIMDGYYKTLFPLNPGGLRPAIPSGFDNETLFQPHNREFLSSSEKNSKVAYNEH